MFFSRSAKHQFHQESFQQIKQELLWLWGHVKRYGMLTLAVGALGLVGTGTLSGSLRTHNEVQDLGTGLDLKNLGSKLNGTDFLLFLIIYFNGSHLITCYC